MSQASVAKKFTKIQKRFAALSRESAQVISTVDFRPDGLEIIAVRAIAPRCADPERLAAAVRTVLGQRPGGAA